MDDLVSVVIPAFNREKTIKRAVESVLSQTYKNIEVIVVDDCSNDNTETILRSINDARLKIVSLRSNRGACYARNIGIKRSKGKYIAFQDSDDVWHKQKLEKQIRVLLDGGDDLVFCAFNRTMENKRKCTRVPSKKFVMPIKQEEVYRGLLMNNYISTQTIFVKSEVVKNILFDEGLPRFQDWDLVLRLSKCFKIGYCDEVLVDVIVQEDSITKNEKKGYEALRKIYEKNHSAIQNDEEVYLEFLRKKCIIGFKAGYNMKSESIQYLKRKLDKKVLAVYLYSMINKKRGV